MKSKRRKWHQRFISLLLVLVMVVGTGTVTYGKAGWAEENGKWYFFDNEGYYVKNTIRKSGNKWYWLDNTGTLIIGQPGKEVTDGKYTFVLTEDGYVEDTIRDQDGNVYDLNEIEWDENSSGDHSPTNDESVFHRAGWNKAGNAWVYCDENYEPWKSGVYEIAGYSYYMNDKGHIEWKSNRSLIDNKYYQKADYSLAVNRWILLNEEDSYAKQHWAYFDENGCMVKGKQTIDKVEYDFGTAGYVVRDDLGIIQSIQLSKEWEDTVAYVGDTIEIPFEIMVKKKERKWVPDENDASPSSAQKATASEGDKGHWEEEWVEEEADYSLFKNTYEVSHTYRVNKGVYQTKYVQGVSRLKYAVETKFDIDWDNQVIKIKIDLDGAVFGNLQIGSKISNNFGVICKYKDDVTAEEKVEDILNRGYYDDEDFLIALKNIDVKELSTALTESLDIREDLKSIEETIIGKYNIQSKSEISSDAQRYLSADDVEVIGLALSVKDKKEANLVFKIDKSNETLPAGMADHAKTVALDMSVSGGGIKSSSLEVPVYICIPLPKGLTGDNLRLFHIHDGKTEELEIKVEGGKVGFVTDKFSSFIFAEDSNGSGGSSNGSGGGGGGSRSGSSRKPAISTQNAIPETPGSWQQDAAGWKYFNFDGTAYRNTWVRKNNQWYWIGEDGYMKTGWSMISGKWYYLMPMTGEMKTGWIADNGSWYYADETGAMATGWVKSGEKWYYLYEDGKMAVSTTTPDGYVVDENGAMI